MSSTKGTGQRVNEEGAVEIKVETVDYRSPAGHDDREPPIKEKVEVIHRLDENPDPGVLANVADDPTKNTTSNTGNNKKD